MFKNVGKELKEIAETHVAGRMIIASLLAVALLIAGNIIAEGKGILVGAVLAAFLLMIVYNVARMEAIRLYAYGELVYRVMSLEKYIVKKSSAPKEKNNEAAEVVAAASTPAPATTASPIPEPAPATPTVKNWFCSSCGAENANWAAFCKKCGKQK